MKKRILTLCMALVLCLSLLAFSAAAGGLPSYSGGSGTEDDPFKLSKVSDLEDLALTVNYGHSYKDTYFVLTADIMTPVDTIIGIDTYPFDGHFDGAGHTVTLAINQPDEAYVGLFGLLSGNGEIKNVSTVGYVISGSDTQTIGGVCGSNTGGTITGCTNNAFVSVTNSASTVLVGGVCGHNVNGSITNCANKACVSCTVAHEDWAGGVCGYNMGGSIANCVNFGSVIGPNVESHCGGICGQNSGGTIVSCFYDNEICNKRGINFADDAANAVLGLTPGDCKAAAGTAGALIDCLNQYAETNSLTKWSLGADGYPELHDHVFDQCAVGDIFLQTPATCVTPAIYYKSCVCGYCDMETAGTFYDSGAQLSGHGAWEFSASGSVLTATCGHDTCTTPKASASLILVAKDRIYNGQPAEVNIIGGEAWTELTGAAVPTIEYYSGDTSLDAAPRDAGTYTAKITAHETDDNEGTASVTFTISPRLAPAPDPSSTSIFYDGLEHDFTAAPFLCLPIDAPYSVADGSITKATAAGEYPVTLKLNANYQWNDGDTEDKLYTFTIEKALLVVQALNKTALVGDSAPAFADSDYRYLTDPVPDDEITVALSYAETPDMSKAGSYAIKATVSGTDAQNYTVIPVDGTLTVNPAPDANRVIIPVPEKTSFLYDGTEKVFMTVADNAGYSVVSGSLKATDADSYTVILSLKDKTNTTWSDGTTEDKVFTFCIDPAPLIITVKDKTASVDDSAAPTLSEDDYTFLRSPVTADLGKITVTLNYCNLDMNQAGAYEIQATVGGDPAKNYDVTVASGTLTVTGSAAPAPSIIGDLNGDGLVDSKDVIILARHVAEWDAYKSLPYLG